MPHRKLDSWKTVQAVCALKPACIIVGSAFIGMTALTSGSALAACTNSGFPTNKVTCKDSDTNGHTVGAVGRLTVNVEADASVSRETGNALDLGALGTLNISTAAGSWVQGGASGHGILAGTTSGGTVNTFGDVTGALDAVNLTFSDNTVVYNNSGTIEGGQTGVVINRELNGGKTTATNTGWIIAGEDGIRVTHNTGDGDVTVENDGAIGDVSDRVGDDGIDVNIKSSGAIAITNGAAGTIFAVDAGIDATNADGALSITNLGTIDASGVAVNAYATTGVTVENSGTLTGLGSQDRASVVAVADGDVTINNDGVVTTATKDPAGLAVRARSDQAIRLTNGEAIHGTVILDGREDTPTTSTFDNAGLWETSGDSTLRALNGVTLNNTGEISTSDDTTFAVTTVNGVNLVKNQGTIRVNGSLAFMGGANLVFDNDGLIDMRDGSTDGRTTVSGAFTGLAGSKMVIDASLGGVGSEADQLIVGAETAGVTSLVVQDSNAGPGGFNGQGIVFAYSPTGASTLGDFVLDPSSSHYDGTRGVLDKGLFFYEIATRPGIDDPNGVAQVLIGVPDAELFQMPRALTAAQDAWFQTAGSWFDRNLDRQRVSVGADHSLQYTDNDTATGPTSGTSEPGVWTKVIGSRTSRSGHQSFSLGERSYEFDTGYNQDVHSVVAGIDFELTDMFGANDTLVVGALAGYVSSQLEFNSAQNGVEMSGMTTGLYASYVNDGFFINALAKVDMLDTQWRTPALAGFDTNPASGDATSYGARTDAGFRFALSPSVFVEPSATLAHVRTDINPLATEGATVTFQGGDSVRGALGLRVGAEIVEADEYTMEASISGRIWNEFQGNNRVRLDSSEPMLSFDHEVSGAFGEVAGSLILASRDSGWSGDLSGGVAFSGDMATTSVKGRLRYTW